MGSASCKNPTSSEENKKKEDTKKITIGVFGLNNAGKTTTVKAIEGAPTDDAEPTIGFLTTKVPYPTTGKSDNKSQERITIIDVSGDKKFRQRSWSEYYNKIHGLIFVVDASDKKKMSENKSTLEDLLENDDLKDKPILILANKQDVRGAISKENDIKEKLDIERLQRKYKIEFCTAISDDKNKGDASIRKGFSWLIQTIDDNYAKINARVYNPINSRAPKPMERKSHTNNQRKNLSDDSDKDDDIVYTRNRATTPPLNKKPPDYRSTITSTKLPHLDLNKSIKKKSGNETYSENDDDDNDIRSRPNISRSTDDFNHRYESTTGGLNKKKKVLGGATTTTSNSNNDLSTKKSNNIDPKSFRSTYEPFPEAAPWSSTVKKPAKTDDFTLRSYNKPSITNDLNKRIGSPLVNDTKLYNSSTTSKRNKGSDDDNDDDFNQKQKLKSPYPLINKPSSSFKKPLSSIYGGDEDDDENDYLKKNTSKTTTKSFGSDDESKNKTSLNKPYQRSTTDRFNPMNEYRATITKPPPSPLTKVLPSKFDYDDLPSSKLNTYSKSNKDDYSSTFTKPTISSRFSNDDNDRPLSSSKINTQSKYGDENRSSSPLRLTTRSKHGDDDLPSSSKPSARSRYDDDDDSPLASKPTTRLNTYNNNNNERPSSALKSTARSRRADDDEYGMPSKSSPKSKFEDDDDDTSPSWKPTTRTNYKANDRSASPSKPTSNSKYDDDDDEDYKPSSKPVAARWNQKDNDRSSSSPAKTASKSKFEDDDDDDDYKPSSKPVARANFRDNDRHSPVSKPTTGSRRFEDDDDDDDHRSSFPAKQASRSKFEDDDDDRPSSSSFKKSNYSSRDDDYHGSGDTRSRYGRDEYDLSKGGSNSTRAGSSYTNRFQ